MFSLAPLRIGLLVLLASAIASPLAHAVAPAAPSNCVATAVNASATIDISWNDNSTNETQWKIQYSVNGAAFIDLGAISSSSTATTGNVGVSLTGALNTTYSFKILAFNGSEYSAASNVATVGTYDLNNPINLNVTSVDPFNVMMTWEEGSTSEAGFAIETKVGTDAWKYLGYVGANVLSVSPINLISPLGTFSFRVRAFKGSPPTTPDSPVGANVSAYSNVATVIAGTYPLTATKVAGKPVINLSWPNILNESGYQIILKAAANTSYTIVGEVAADVTTYQILAPDINPATSYSIIVRPFAGSSSNGIMGESSVASVAVDAYTLTAAAVPGQTAINLTWPDLQNETAYGIYYLVPGAASYSFLHQVTADVTSYQVTAPQIEPTKSYSFVIQPINANGAICESSVASATVDGITSKSGESDIPGAAFSHTFTDNVTRAAVSSRSLTGVPSTLIFNNGTGALSGVFPALGNYTLTYTVNFADSSHLTQTFYIRVRPAAGAPLVGTLIPAWSGVVGASRDTPVAGTFSDPEADSAVRVSTTLGTMDFILFNAATPATVTNFMSYVNAGKYTDVVFHRSVANFVIQGGGFKGAGSGSNFTSVVTAPTVVNEPGIANVRGTLSMAKNGGIPDSATSQFFVSLNDNRANLDYQNGGFTVFGRVAGNGMTVADNISALPTATYNLLLDGGSTATQFSDFPMNVLSPPATMDQSQVVKINSVDSIPTLSYSITGNTSPGVATASILNGQLHLTGLSGGQTTITVSATDLDNLTTSQTVSVVISDTYTTWAARTTFPGGQSTAGQNPDGDALTNLQEYAFMGNPAVSSPAPLPVAGKTGVAPAAQYMTVSFPLRKFTSGLSYVVEANNQLSGTWTPVWSSASDPGFSQAQVVSAVSQTDRTVVTIKDSVALGTLPRRFLRVRVTQE